MMGERTKKIRSVAKNVVYISPDENPFKEGNQFHKAYEKFKIHYNQMEVKFKDLEEVYEIPTIY
jgi:hypothetical protein